MSHSDQNNTEYEWTFPCTLPIKIMGPARERLHSLSVEIILKHVPDFDHSNNISSTQSRTGKYLSLTANVTFSSKNQIDALFAELAHHQQNGDDISFVI